MSLPPARVRWARLAHIGTTMHQTAPRRAKPPLVIGDIDYRNLSALALAAESRMPEVAIPLLDELDRAKVVPQRKVPADAVRMGSTVRYRTASGAERVVTLVPPGEADIDAGRISIMTPIGAALIGLSRGQSITWTSRDGREQELTILSVETRVSDGATS
jgi:regulator of nucleoside diphosphate kinase